METTLIIMAAGIGSRFGGGIKQLAPVGPSGEIIMDYSIHDALEAGFNKVVFIIRKDLEKDFREIIGNRIEKICPCAYAFQAVENLPGGFKNPEGRTKPWGTGHAILCCRDKINEPFAVINADDYYGRNAYTELHEHLVNAEGLDLAMVAFDLKNTVTENGTVARGVCEIENGYLKTITERTKIKDFKYTEDEETWYPLDKDTQVSMNLWGFTPEIFDVLEKHFEEFKADLKNPLKDEFFLPLTVDMIIKSGKGTVKAFNCRDKWYGMTYREDMDSVKEAMARMIEEGYYNGL